jgi:hypothetical protein
MPRTLEKFSINILSILCSTFLLSNANAGTFSIECLGLNDIDCGKLISDIVTEKFTSKYSANDYQITLLAIQTKNGITASHASVAPKITSASGFSVIGTRAWVITKVSQDLSTDGLLNSKLESSRNAVKNMMEYCEENTDCHVYNYSP